MSDQEYYIKKMARNASTTKWLVGCLVLFIVGPTILVTICSVIFAGGCIGLTAGAISRPIETATTQPIVENIPTIIDESQPTTPIVNNAERPIAEAIEPVESIKEELVSLKELKLGDYKCNSETLVCSGKTKFADVRLPVNSIFKVINITEPVKVDIIHETGVAFIKWRQEDWKRFIRLDSKLITNNIPSTTQSRSKPINYYFIAPQEFDPNMFTFKPPIYTQPNHVNQIRPRVDQNTGSQQPSDFNSEDVPVYWVDEYFRDDGTQVDGHWKRYPNSGDLEFDNY